jgi:ribose transport system ATP-binding protein
MSEPPAPILVADGLSKLYGGIVALDDVGLALVPGEIHGICGENGAGKSTFIKILGGLVRPDHGHISVDGHPLALGQRTDPRLISIVHQELAIVPTLSVLDNIMLGSGGASLLYLAGRFRGKVRDGLDEVGLSHVALDLPASALSLAERQLVEIARGIARQARVLLLDEPTATLSDAEIGRVFATARLLRDRGTALVFVSHRLDEVFALTDRATVFRNGRRVLTEGTAALRPKDLVRAMIGRERAGRDPKTLVLVGSNCSIEGVNAIKSGTQYATVLQSSIDDGTYAAEAVVDLLDGKAVPKTRYLPHLTITRANVSACDAATGH